MREKNPAKDPSLASVSNINSDIFNTGVMLKYMTDEFYGIKFGTTVQSSYSPFADGSSTKVGTAKGDFNGDMSGSGAQLSELYIQYTLGQTTAKLGRQFIATPLISGSGSRMVRQAFEGAIITNSDLPQTTLIGGVVTKYQPRTTGSIAGDAYEDGSIGQFESIHSLGLGYGDAIYTLTAINKSITGLTLTGQWASLDGYADFYYLESAYASKLGSINYGFAANYELKDPETGHNGQMYGAKFSLGYGDFKSYVAYTRITKDNDLSGIDGAAGFGSGAQTAFAQGYTRQAGEYSRDTKAYSIDANYDFKTIGLLLGARYTGVTVDSAAANLQDRGYTDLYSIYNFTGALKGFSTELDYQDWERDVDGHEVWFKAVYKF